MMERSDQFTPLGWYAIASWGRPRPAWKITITRPEGWTDQEWDQLFHDIERDIYLDSQEDWAYGPHPDDVEAYRCYWL